MTSEPPDTLRSPTPPIELTGTASHWGEAPTLPDGFVERLRSVCRCSTDPASTAAASRDWWPLALHWSLTGEVPRRAPIVAHPTDSAQVASIVALCNEARVPVVAAGGRSGVVGGTVPMHGGVLLDLTGLVGIVSVDAVSGVVRVRPGTFGPDLERALRDTHSLSVGHYPQSFELATVGGWVAGRGAGQYSTRYGKIDSMVVGLEVVLADGRIVRTGGSPAAAQGPDLTQLFVGSEGTLGVITEVSLRAHPVPPHERRAAYSFATIHDGFEACRRMLQRGATPAVLRLYDAIESQRSHDGDGSNCVLLVLDEGDRLIVDATMAVVADECRDATPLPDHFVGRWMAHRNDTSALQQLTRKGFVVDTLEIAAPWSQLDDIVEHTTAALLAVPHARAASCHLSHSYSDGACLYFTFAATPPADAIEATYTALWDAGQRAVLAHGGNLSHHHGVGLNRSRFMAAALGPAFDVLQTVKDALDPAGIMNPGKLGLRHIDTAPGALNWP